MDYTSTLTSFKDICKKISKDIFTKIVVVENVNYWKSGLHQDRVRITSGTRITKVQASGTSIISPRLRAATHTRFAALGGLEPSQARPQQAPLVGAALETVLPYVAA